MKTQLLLGLSLCIWSLHSYAETLPEFEQALIKKYDQSVVSGRIEADQFNSDIAEAVMTKVQQDPKTWSYDFSALANKHMLNIHYSPDRKIKVYQFDVSSGGTMRSFNNLAQWQTPTGLQTQLIEEDVLIRKIYQTELAKRDTYFFLTQSIGSNCVGAANITAYHLATTKIVASSAFQSKTQRMQDISVPFDCQAYAASSPQLQDRTSITEYLIRVDPKMNFIDIHLLNPQYVPQDKYLRYKKEQTHYRYQGVVNAKK